MKKLTKKRIEAIEDLGWVVTDYGDYYYISKFSSLGEDFNFDVSKENAIELANLLRGMNVYVNLIGYNETNPSCIPYDNLVNITGPNNSLIFEIF